MNLLALWTMRASKTSGLPMVVLGIQKQPRYEQVTSRLKGEFFSPPLRNKSCLLESLFILTN